MWIYDPNRRCKICGITNTLFFAQKQRTEQITVNNICQGCKKFERSEYYYAKDKIRIYLKGVK